MGMEYKLYFKSHLYKLQNTRMIKNKKNLTFLTIFINAEKIFIVASRSNVRDVHKHLLKQFTPDYESFKCIKLS